MSIQSVLFAIVQRQDADPAIRALTAAGLRVTAISSLGSFLHEGNVTLFLGLARADVPRVTELLASQCHQRTLFVNATPMLASGGIPQAITPIEVQVGGAIVFTFAVDQSIRIDRQHKEHTFEPHARDESAAASKLVFAILPQDIAVAVQRGLESLNLRSTMISTTGGFWRKGNATLLVGVDAEQIETAVNQIETAFAAWASKNPSAQQTINVFVLDTHTPEKPGSKKMNDAATAPLEMLIAIVPGKRLAAILDRLSAANYRATVIGTSGGLFAQGYATLLVGVQAAQVNEAWHCITQAEASALTSEATLFVLQVEHYTRV